VADTTPGNEPSTTISANPQTGGPSETTTPPQTTIPAEAVGNVEIPQHELDDLRDRLSRAEEHRLRASADLDNLQKRFQNELTRAQTAERRRALSLWVATLDDLERALAHAGAERSPIIEGVEAIVSHATATIASLGYPRFGEKGDTFDPELHDVITTVPAEPAHLLPNTVVAVLKPGYGTAEDLLRPASVVVAKEPD